MESLNDLFPLPVPTEGVPLTREILRKAFGLGGTMHNPPESGPVIWPMHPLEFYGPAFQELLRMHGRSLLS